MAEFRRHLKTVKMHEKHFLFLFLKFGTDAPSCYYEYYRLLLTARSKWAVLQKKMSGLCDIFVTLAAILAVFSVRQSAGVSPPPTVSYFFFTDSICSFAQFYSYLVTGERA